MGKTKGIAIKKETECMRAKKKTGERERDREKERHICTQKEENRREGGILEKRVRKDMIKKGLECVWKYKTMVKPNFFYIFR